MARETPPTSADAVATLSDGREMPLLGLGTYQAAGEETKQAVLCALRLQETATTAGATGEVGEQDESAGGGGEESRVRMIRHIDTAELYGNESDCGAAIAELLASGEVTREELWVTTKLWPKGRDFDATIAACERSLQALGLDYVDLYLIHAPVDKEHRLEQWHALETLQERGLCKSIGVSNYGEHHLEELLKNCNVSPVCNQIELSPYLQRTDLVEFCRDSNILPVAYSPLTKGQMLADPVLVEVAERCGKSPAQVLIRWALDQGFAVIPKSVHEERIRENADVMDFTLSDEDMAVLNGMEQGLVTGWDPTEAP